MRIVLLRVSAWTLLAIIVALSFVPPAFRPVTGMPNSMEHAAIFLLNGAIFASVYRIRLIFFLAAAMTFAGCLEVFQSFAPGRHARLTDALVDAISACFGILIASAMLRLQQRKMGSWPGTMGGGNHRWLLLTLPVRVVTDTPTAFRQLGSQWMQTCPVDINLGTIRLLIPATIMSEQVVLSSKQAKPI
jgi:VanZ family protein